MTEMANEDEKPPLLDYAHVRKKRLRVAEIVYVGLVALCYAVLGTAVMLRPRTTYYSSEACAWDVAIVCDECSAALLFLAGGLYGRYRRDRRVPVTVRVATWMSLALPLSRIIR